MQNSNKNENLKKFVCSNPFNCIDIQTDIVLRDVEEKYGKTIKSLYVTGSGDPMASKEFINSIEISIDAGSKETYENVTRFNGDWGKLIQNLKFISTINSLKTIIVSMVVSEKNFKEMEIFYKLMSEIFSESKAKLNIQFRQHVYWSAGKYTPEEVHELQVFRTDHSKFDEFNTELLKMHNKPNTNHNFHHLL